MANNLVSGTSCCKESKKNIENAHFEKPMTAIPLSAKSICWDRNQLNNPHTSLPSNNPIFSINIILQRSVAMLHYIISY